MVTIGWTWHTSMCWVGEDGGKLMLIFDNGGSRKLLSKLQCF